MDPSAFDSTKAELEARRPALQKIMRGLRRVEASPDLPGPALQGIRMLLDEFEQRDLRMSELLASVNQSRVGMESLLAHGYPELPTIQIDAEAQADLEEQRDSILAALGQLVPGLRGRSRVGPEEPLP